MQSILIIGLTIHHITFQHVRSAPATEITISHPDDDNRSRSFTGWFDTGATSSAISTEVFEFIKPKQTGLANGVLYGVNDIPHDEPLYTVKFKILGFPGPSIFEDTLEVIVASKLSQGVDVLIGLDVLQKSRFNYDGVNKSYTIEFINSDQSVTNTP